MDGASTRGDRGQLHVAAGDSCMSVQHVAAGDSCMCTWRQGTVACGYSTFCCCFVVVFLAPIVTGGGRGHNRTSHRASAGVMGDGGMGTGTDQVGARRVGDVVVVVKSPEHVLVLLLF